MTGPSETKPAGGLAAFTRLVAEDRALAARLRPIEEPAALILAALAEGAARGLVFTAAEVEAVMQEKRHGFLMHPTPMVPLPVHAPALPRHDMSQRDLPYRDLPPRDLPPESPL